MVEEAENQVEEGAAPKRKKPLVLMSILAASIVVGGAVGVFVAVPLLVGSPPVVASAEMVEDSLAAPARSGRATRDGPPILFTVDNMVLNPRGTGGSRFLMVTTAFEVSDAKVLEQMRIREFEIRDHLLWAYGQKTVEELADLEQREALREHVRSEIESLFHRGAIARVYLPQFVIQ